MPAQSLSRVRSRRPAQERRLRHRGSARCWRGSFVFGGGLALTAYGAHEMYEVVAVGGVTPLEWALLVLFVANFSWIALAFTSAIAGSSGSSFAGAEAASRGPTVAARAHRGRDADLQRGAGPRLRRAAGDGREVEATGLGGVLRLVLPVRHHRSGGRASPRSAPSSRCGRRLGHRRDLLPPPARRTSPQGRQHRRFLHALGRRLRLYAGARRRQPDDRRRDRRRSPPRWRPIPTPASSRPLPLIINRDTLFRPPAAIRRPRLRSGHRRRRSPGGSGARAITGATTPSSAPRRLRRRHCGLPILPGAALRRPHPQPRFRRGGADPARRLDRLHAADDSAAASRRARPR